MKKMLSYNFLLLSLLSVFLSCGNDREDYYLKLLKDAEERDLGFEPNGRELERLRMNVRQAFRSARPFLQRFIIAEEDFLHYVLPPRVNLATDASWRSVVQERHGRSSIVSPPFTLQSFKDSCEAINKRLSREFSFGPTRTVEAFSTYEMLLGNKTGSCVGMTHLAAYTFRALGVPVSIDFVPVWGNTNTYGHQWNVLLLNGEQIPFMGAESGVGDYEPLVISRDSEAGTVTMRIPPKVYRECQLCGENAIHFMGKSVVDLTSEYVPVRDIHIEDNVPVGMPWLAVFTKGMFLPVSTGARNQDGYVFSDMATGLLYFPVSGKSTVEPLGFPIYLGEKEGQKILKPDFANRISFEVRSLNSVPAAQISILSSQGYETFSSLPERNTVSICPKPVHKERYRLFVWDGGWKNVCSSRSDSGVVRFRNVPSNAAYVVAKNTEEIKDTRPFIVVDSELVWL